MQPDKRAVVYSLHPEGRDAFDDFHDLRTAMCGVLDSEPAAHVLPYVQIVLSERLRQSLSTFLDVYGAARHAEDLYQTHVDTLRAIWLCPAPGSRPGPELCPARPVVLEPA